MASVESIEECQFLVWQLDYFDPQPPLSLSFYKRELCFICEDGDVSVGVVKDLKIKIKIIFLLQQVASFVSFVSTHLFL